MGVFQGLPEPTRHTDPRPLLSLYGIIYVIWYTSGLPEATGVRLRLPNSLALLCVGRWRIHQGAGMTCPPMFQAEGGQSCKSHPPTFWTHNNAIAGFTSQSLGLPAYACKTDSSTAIKLAPRMHQNLPF